MELLPRLRRFARGLWVGDRGPRNGPGGGHHLDGTHSEKQRSAVERIPEKNLRRKAGNDLDRALLRRARQKDRREAPELAGRKPQRRNPRHFSGNAALATKSTLETLKPFQEREQNVGASLFVVEF